VVISEVGLAGYYSKATITTPVRAWIAVSSQTDFVELRYTLSTGSVASTNRPGHWRLFSLIADPDPNLVGKVRGIALFLVILLIVIELPVLSLTARLGFTGRRYSAVPFMPRP
jgi:hypothetical protein